MFSLILVSLQMHHGCHLSVSTIFGAHLPQVGLALAEIITQHGELTLNSHLTTRFTLLELGQLSKSSLGVALQLGLGIATEGLETGFLSTMAIIGQDISILLM